MATCKKPLRRSMLTYGTIFLAIMFLLMSVQTTLMLRSALYRRYDSHIKDVLTDIEHMTDLDDLGECIRTLTPSEKYNALQQKFNTMVDDYQLLYIYIAIPSEEDVLMYNVLSSTSSAERAAGQTDYPIMYTDPSFYTAEELKPYIEASKKTGVYSSFASDSSFGAAYTVCKPLYDSGGEYLGLLCGDISLAELNNTVNGYIMHSIGFILLICILFGVIMSLWLQRTITGPLGRLEQSARGFADKSHGKRDLNALTFEAPEEINTENEIQSLSESIQQMSENMKRFVGDVLTAEKRAQDAEQEVESVSRIAYEDALTQAKSKVAYDERVSELGKEIAHDRAQFAMVMVDLNNTKRINDICGLEHGNSYIVRGREVISSVYKNSPVYRIGGDEFVVILEGDDYKDRDELFAVLEESFLSAQEDTAHELWERCSAAAGMTDYIPGADDNAEQVFRRAERIMIRNKRIMKNNTNR